MAAPTAGNPGSNQTGAAAAAAIAPTQAPVVGDLAVLVIAHRDIAVGVPTPSDTAGFGPWTMPNGTYVTATNTFLSVWTAVVESTSPTMPTISDSGDHQQSRLFYVNHPSGTPVVHGVQPSVDTTSDTSGTMTGFTTTVADCLILLLASGSGPDSNTSTEYGTVTNGNLTGITEVADNSVQTGGGSAKLIAKAVLAAAGAIGDSTYTKVNASTKAHLVMAISPPVVGAPAAQQAMIL